MNDPYDVARNVSDAATFLEFLEALEADWEARGHSTAWANHDLGSFFEAAVAGAKDHGTSRIADVFETDNPWRQAASILLLGKIYE